MEDRYAVALIIRAQNPDLPVDAVLRLWRDQEERLMAPDGSQHDFPTQAAANQFKRAIATKSK